MPDSVLAARKLGSWKEIASYIGKTERTAKRWEQARGLPVHRVPGGGRQAIFAYAHELDAWLHSNPAAVVENNDPTAEIATTVATSNAATAVTEQPVSPGIPTRTVSRWLIGAGSAVALLVIATAVATRQSWPGLAVVNPTRITQSQTRVLSPLLSDGVQIYYPQFENGRYGVAATSVNGGNSTAVVTGISNPELCDLAPDGHAMLLRSLSGSRDEQAPIYVQLDRGAATKKVGEALAYDAAWYPDGRKILYSTDGEVYSTDTAGGSRDRLFAIPGNAFWFRWSPDGTKLRFTVIDKKSEETSIWEFKSGARDPHRLFGEVPFHLCCGSWTPDGTYYLFQVRNGNTFQIWASREQRRFLLSVKDKPFPLVFGATSYRGPLASRNGARLFVRSETPKTELVRYDSNARDFIPMLPGISARTLAFSGDGVWIAYTSLTDNNLWRCRADGTGCLQLTREFKDTIMPRWSPDGETIAFMGLPFSGEWGIYAISRNGGAIRSLSQADHAQGDPDWSPDGHRLVFGEVLPVAQPRGIHILDLATNDVSALPNSTEYFSPRWSPDGRFVVALHAGDLALGLFDFNSKTWRRLVALPSGYPNWSRDGKSVYFVSTIAGSRAIFRIKTTDAKPEKVADLMNVERTPFFMGDWVGLAHDDAPIAVRNLTTEDIYAWDLVVR